MTNQSYLLDNTWERTRERFDLLEGLLDPATIEHMHRIGVSEGWNCLEVGGGGGSIVEWLCHRVGQTGKVLSTDINTRFLDAIDRQNLKILEHDIVRDDLPVNEFDLAHCRWVLVHVPEREFALQKMVEAVKPGGWLFVEESDGSLEAEPLVDDSLKEILYEGQSGVQKLTLQRFDPSFPGRLPGLFRSMRFQSVQAEGRTRYIQGGTLQAKVPQLRIEQIKKRVIEAGFATEQQIEDLIALFDNPSFAYRWNLTVSVWGQKPAL